MADVLLNPYLQFKGNARDAITFYEQVFGGDVDLTTFGEGMGADGAAADLVMHAQLTTSDGMTLMASDVPDEVPYQPGSSVSISLSGDDEATLRRYWDALADGGQVMMPLEQAPWGDTFGACVDRFGTSWMVNIAGTGG